MTKQGAALLQSPVLRGSSIALAEQDGFLAGYLTAAFEQHGAVVKAVHGAVDEMMAMLESVDPRPVAAVLDARLPECSRLTDLLGRMQVPFLLIAQGRTLPPSEQPAIPLWQWPFGAFQLVAALAELLDERREIYGSPLEPQ